MEDACAEILDQSSIRSGTGASLDAAVGVERRVLVEVFRVKGADILQLVEQVGKLCGRWAS